MPDARAPVARPPLQRLATILASLLFLSAPAHAAEGELAAEPVPEDPSVNSAYRIADALDDPPALAPDEPMYFIVGSDGDTVARFQFSFQYRVFDEASYFVDWASWMRRIYLGYTQTSVWNLSEDSKPFRDTSYRPSVFYQAIELREGWRPDFLRFGYEHESNGQDVERSRSIDTLFVRPGWVFELGERNLLVAPKIYGYLDKGENRDIDRYRGNVDLLLRYGRENGWLLGTQLRWGHGGRGSAQIDLSYPLRRPIFARTGGYLYVQLFQGYGDSLLGYDRKEDLQIRVGLAIVR